MLANDVFEEAGVPTAFVASRIIRANSDEIVEVLLPLWKLATMGKTLLHLDQCRFGFQFEPVKLEDLACEGLIRLDAVGTGTDVSFRVHMVGDSKAVAVYSAEVERRFDTFVDELDQMVRRRVGLEAYEDDLERANLLIAAA